jgi:N-acetylglucosaminyldiphosphoundecaprenol N-acetyl-beta-D-mannosaminyltransferase
MSKVNLLGVGVDALTLEEVLKFIRGTIASGKRARLSYAHVMALNLAYEQEWLRTFLKEIELVYCDGMGVQLGARLLGRHLPQRFTLADWIDRLALLAAQNDFSLFFLGNPPGSAQRAAENLQARFPGLQVVGVHHGFYDKTAGSEENEAVIEQINAVQPDILMVGFGVPIQERWVKENWEHLQVNIALSCGAIFEYVAGDLPRGPQWMTDHYMEWLARVLISPRRYWRRYWRDNPLFLARVLRQRISGHIPDEHYR